MPSRPAPPAPRPAPLPETGAPLLKDGFTAATVTQIADALAQVHPPFDRAGFLVAATTGLEALGLMARVRQVAQALAAFLPPRLADAAAVVEQTLGDPPAELQVGEGMAAFRHAPFLDWVAIAGLSDPVAALPLLARLTRHFTGEFAIRAFLAVQLDATLAHAARWVTDDDPRVRRLASEGTRPMLPWGRHVAALKAEPARALALIAPLAADPSDSVRRSAANHLNDVSRIDASLALAHASAWLAQGGPAARATVRHALRNLVKQGHPEALALLGFDVAAAVRLSGLALSAASVPVGGELRFAGLLHNDTSVPVQACVDYAISYASARGAPRRKVFKGTVLTLAPGASQAFAFRRDFVPRTTRVLYPGEHALELRVNGSTLGVARFELR